MGNRKHKVQQGCKDVVLFMHDLKEIMAGFPQLIFARSKMVSAEISLPRKEPMVATLNASTGHAAKLALGDLHKRCCKLTDSQVTLHWIGSETVDPKSGGGDK